MLRLSYLSRGEALGILGVKPQTLYSYVSRGLIRRLPQFNGRRSYYLREDVERLKARSAARSGHGAAAASAVHWGEPVLVTSITEITAHGPRYRDRLAVDLAEEGRSFEAVAEFLWTASWPVGPVIWTLAPQAVVSTSPLINVKPLHSRPHIRHLLMQIVLGLGISAGCDLETGAAPETTIQSARRLLLAMTSIFGFLGPERAPIVLAEGESIAEGLARGLGVEPNMKNLRAMNAALILFADHEFTPATFAARIAASVGNDLHACVGAALNVLFGSITGLGCDQIEEVLARSGGKAPAPRSHAEETARALPGFDHPLYPHGDPRAIKLLEIASEIGGGSRAMEQTLNAVEEIHANVRASFTFEEALVILCRTMGMANDVASGLLALGRVAGWVAHIIEQQKAPFIIRPRGKFISIEDGVPPHRRN